MTSEAQDFSWDKWLMARPDGHVLQLLRWARLKEQFGWRSRLVTLPDGRRFAIAVYLAGSTATPAQREAAHGAVARLAVEALR